MPLSSTDPTSPDILHIIMGAALVLLGLSFAWKFVQAALFGKATYWTGFDHFGWYFTPFARLVTPFFTHVAPSEKSLIKEKQEGWIHLVFGPAFFLVALLFLTAGSDFMGLPGTRTMNTVLTMNRPDVPPAIVYLPPFTYKFPILKKSWRVIRKSLTTPIPEDPNQSYHLNDDKMKREGEEDASEDDK